MINEYCLKAKLNQQNIIYKSQFNYFSFFIILFSGILHPCVYMGKE